MRFEILSDEDDGGRGWAIFDTLFMAAVSALPLLVGIAMLAAIKVSDMKWDAGTTAQARVLTLKGGSRRGGGGFDVVFRLENVEAAGDELPKSFTSSMLGRERENYAIGSLHEARYYREDGQIRARLGKLNNNYRFFSWIVFLLGLRWFLFLRWDEITWRFDRKSRN